MSTDSSFQPTGLFPTLESMLGRPPSSSASSSSSSASSSSSQQGELSKLRDEITKKENRIDELYKEYDTADAKKTERLDRQIQGIEKSVVELNKKHEQIIELEKERLVVERGGKAPKEKKRPNAGSLPSLARNPLVQVLDDLDATGVHVQFGENRRYTGTVPNNFDSLDLVWLRKRFPNNKSTDPTGPRRSTRTQRKGFFANAEDDNQATLQADLFSRKESLHAIDTHNSPFFEFLRPRVSHSSEHSLNTKTGRSDLYSTKRSLVFEIGKNTEDNVPLLTQMLLRVVVSLSLNRCMLNSFAFGCIGRDDFYFVAGEQIIRGSDISMTIYLHSVRSADVEEAWQWLSHCDPGAHLSADGRALMRVVEKIWPELPLELVRIALLSKSVSYVYEIDFPFLESVTSSNYKVVCVNREEKLRNIAVKLIENPNNFLLEEEALHDIDPEYFYASVNLSDSTVRCATRFCPEEFLADDIRQKIVGVETKFSTGRWRSDINDDYAGAVLMGVGKAIDFPAWKSSTLFSKLCHSLDLIHTKKWFHCDCRVTNMMMYKDTPMLIDFDHACRQSNICTPTTEKNARWCAYPETLQGLSSEAAKQYQWGEKDDIRMLANVLLQQYSD